MEQLLRIAAADGPLFLLVFFRVTGVLMLAPVMAVLSVRQRRIAGGAADIKRPPLIPLFVLAFVACVVMRSTGIVPAALLGHAKIVQTALLTAAMFALGTGVHVSIFKKVGVRPFVLAAASTVWVAVIALTGVLLANG